MKGGRFANLKWVKPKIPKSLPTDLALLSANPLGRAVREAVMAVGLPRAAKPTATPQAQAIELLQAAAEVEHALLTEYLYAAYSIDPVGPAAGLRDAVAQIAIEEMGHLITVQNLLLALGEDPYFNRENVPLKGKPAGQYPFAIRFEPLSGDSLAKYVTTESIPLNQVADPQLKEKLIPIFARAEQAAGTTISHVGLLYAKLFWLFQPDDSPHPYWRDLPVDMFPSDWHIPDKALKGLADSKQATATDFGREPVDPSHPNADRVYVIEVRARDHALFALSQIAAQGGLQPGVNSHFSQFLQAYDDFSGTLPTGVFPVPVNPNTEEKKQSNPTAEAGRITHPKALPWARLFDVRYQLLLLELWLSVWTDPAVTGELSREKMFERTLQEMWERIGRIAGRILPNIDLKDQTTTAVRLVLRLVCLMPRLPSTEKTVKDRMKQLLATSEELAVEIEQLAAPNAPTTAERNVVTGMRASDGPLLTALGGA